MRIGLFTLTYAQANLRRRVSYEDAPRQIVVEDARLDPDVRSTSTMGSPPDSWPKGDQELLFTRYEGNDTVRVYATRVYPYARFEVEATPPATTCDLQVSSPGRLAAGNGFEFTVTTSHGPWASSLSPNAGTFTENKSTYLVGPGDYDVYVRDAAGCQQKVTATVYATAPSAPTPTPGNPSAGMILLRRRALPSLRDPDLFRIKEEYYDPKTRKAYFFETPDSANGDEYSRPVTEIIDRWCVDPGTPPYREVRVSHNGTGGVDFTNVDGVSACMAFCTLGVTLTPSQVLEGRGALTAVATGAQGTVLFSFDGFDTPGLPSSPDPATGRPSYVLRSQKVGTYTVTAKEVRTGGCVATATASLVVAYGPRYEHRFRDRDDVACRVRIFQREYEGEVEQVKGQPGAVTVEWPGSATDHVFTNLVRGSSCELALYMAYREQLLPLFSGDERLHRIEYERAGQLFWKGYVLPEQYQVAFLTPPATFSLSATDGLGTLSTVPFVGSVGEALRGDWTLLRLLQFLLAKLDLDLPLNVLFNLYPSSGKLGTGALEQIKVDVSQYQDEKGKAWDCGKILTELLTPFAARLYQQDGAWWLERLADLSTEEMTYASYRPDGTRGADVRRSLLVEVRPPAERLLRWKEKSQYQSLLPAVSAITVLADPGEPANLLRRATPRNTDLPGTLPASWSASPGPPASLLVYQGKDKPPLLRLTGTTDFAKTPERGAWVQTPKSVAVPLRDLGDTNPYNGTFTLSFTAKPYGNTPTEVVADQPTMYAAVNFGGLWVAPYLAFPGETPDVEKVLFQSYVRFADSKEVKVSVRGYGASPQGPQPIFVRFYQPVGGKSATTVDISDIEVTWENETIQVAETYTTEYRTDTGALVSRVDAATTLFHSDTRYARRQGTLLDAGSLPVQGWYEAASPGILLEAADHLVIYRNFWQRSPAQVLGGKLRGPLAGPGALLTDPNEARPGVYVLTAATHDGPLASWQLMAVQLRTLTPPPFTLPEHAIYHEDLTAVAREDGTIMTYEHD
jgi:hypothetical protein